MPVLWRIVAWAPFLDPPYNVPIEGHVFGLGAIRHKKFAFASGEMSEVQFTAFLTSFLKATVVHLRPGGILFCFMDWRHMGELAAAGRAGDLELKNLCVWCKNSGGMDAFYRSQYELVFVFKAPGDPHLNTFELGQHGRYPSTADTVPTSGSTPASTRFARAAWGARNSPNGEARRPGGGCAQGCAASADP